MPLLAPFKQADNSWHFERLPGGFLTKDRFETFYDRLGKFLHADNPWGNDKGVSNFGASIPGVIASLRALLEWHATVIRSPTFNGLWVVEVPKDGRQPHVITAQADGDFVVL